MTNLIKKISIILASLILCSVATLTFTGCDDTTYTATSDFYWSDDTDTVVEVPYKYYLDNTIELIMESYSGPGLSSWTKYVFSCSNDLLTQMNCFWSNTTVEALESASADYIIIFAYENNMLKTMTR